MDNTKTSLNAGELTDELAGRMDLSKVQMGLSIAENVRVLRVGGVTRRAGFAHAAMSKFPSTYKSRLKGVRFSGYQGYVLEFSHYTMRVFKDGKLRRNNGIITPSQLRIPDLLTPPSLGNRIVNPAPPVNNMPAWTSTGGVFEDAYVCSTVYFSNGRWIVRYRLFGETAPEYWRSELGLISPADAESWEHMDGNGMRDWNYQAVSVFGAAVLEYATPWSEDQIFKLQFTQRIDRLIVASGDVELYSILHLANDGWEVSPFQWQERVWEPYDDVTDPVTLQISVTAVGATGYATASQPVFGPEWVGTRLRTAHVRPETPVRGMPGDIDKLGGALSFNAATGVYPAGKVIYMASDGTRTGGKYAGLTPVGNRQFWRVVAPYNGPGGDFVPGVTDADGYPTFFEQGGIVVPPQEVFGAFTFETQDTWKGTYVLERSYNAGLTWNPVKTCQSRNDKNFLVQDSEKAESRALFRVLVLDFDNTNINNARFVFTALSTTIFGVFRLDAFSTTAQMFGTVEQEIESTFPTTEWYEDAFNPKNGYPVAVTFHQKRLWLGGSKRRPQTVYSSRTRRPFDFTQGTLADDGMNFEMDSSEYEAIECLESHLSLLAITTANVWAISSPNGMSVTPENNACNPQVALGGVRGISAVKLQNNVLFLQAQGRKVQELTGGSVEYGGYTNVDVTQLASHITRGGVVQMDAGKSPDSALFVVTGGQLAVLTYERAQNVVGWSRYLTMGTIESVGITTGKGEDDEVYIAVDRPEPDGTSSRRIERLAPDMLRAEEEHDMNALAFLDAYVTDTDTSGFGTNVLDGLNHLEGRLVQVFADGEYKGEFVVSGATVDLPPGVTVEHAVIGLPYASLAKTMPLDMGAIGNKTSVPDVIVRFRNSLGMEFSQDGVSYSEVQIEPELTVDNAPFKLQSGDAQSTLHSTWVRKPSISIRQILPYPMTILAVRYKAKVNN